MDEGDESRGKYSATIVLGRMSGEEERVQWVHDKLKDIEDPQIYIVDKADTPGPHLQKNHGREAAVYMSYIVDHYDNLHDITFFWHNDEKVWHNNLLLSWDSVETINRMDRENIMATGYVPSRCDLWPGCPAWIKFNPTKAEHNLDPHRLGEMFTPELFHNFFPDADEFPPFFSGTCCSQFAVSRDAIRSRPKSTYEAILEWVLEYQYDDRSGMVMELTWPYLFANRGSLCPSMETCYCKTYNICLEESADVEDLANWNDLRTRREEVKWQVAFLEEALEATQRSDEALGASEDQVLEVENKFQPEIEKLSGELEHLTNVTWQARENIIHRWKLPPPLVGW